jgi:hypothetical protein
MNVIFNTPLVLTLSSAKLLLEDTGFGTIQFKFLDQPMTLSVTSSSYHYDTVFNVGDRVKLIHEISYFGINSEGILQAIILDPTDDKADVLFDTIYPNNTITTDNNTVLGIQSGTVSVLFRVSLNTLALV